MSTEHPPVRAEVTAGVPDRDGPQTIDSAELFAGRREVVILHNHDRYVLRITRQGKLILNK